MATSSNPITSGIGLPPDPATSATANQGAATGQVVNEDTFLQLLVAQIKNQDPLNPADGVQFLTQLAQFSELEQLIGIRGDMQAIRQALDPSAAPANPGGTQAPAQP